MIFSIQTSQIKMDTDTASNTTKEAEDTMKDLRERLEAVRRRFKRNEINVMKAKEQADTSRKLVTDTERVSDILEAFLGTYKLL